MSSIQLSELTTVSVTGTGAFDQLMQAVKGHLEQEYTAGRIKGGEYTQVYLGSVVAVLDQSVRFLAAAQQNALLEAQIEKIRAEIELVQVQKANAVLEGQNLLKQNDLIQAQITKIEAEVPKVEAEIAYLTKQGQLIDAQIPKVEAERLQVIEQTTLIQSQKDKTVADIALSNQQRTNLIAEALNIPKQGLILDRQSAQLLAQAGLTEQQKLNLIAEALNIPKQGQVLDKTRDKADAEISVLAQKKLTEEAQTRDTINGQAVAGVIGKQKELYTAQKDGYTRKAEVDVMQIMAQAYAVQRTTDEDLPIPSSLSATAINQVVTKAVAGIGA